MSATDVQTPGIAGPIYLPHMPPQDASAEPWSPVQQVPSAPMPVPPPPYPHSYPGQDELPPEPPPYVPPPSQGPGIPYEPGPTIPAPPAPADPVPPPADDGGFNVAPWLLGAGAIGAGVAGILAIRTGARNVRALQATAASFNSGSMHQGGLQAIRDAELAARFTGGIGLGDYLSVALPGVNRLGVGRDLSAVARGHLDHAELLSASAALRRGTTNGVAVNDPLRRQVLGGLEDGRSMGAILDELHRSAGGAKPVFDDPRLVRYWDRTSIVERGALSGGEHVTSGVDAARPELALRMSDEGTELVETGRDVRINELVAARGADLDGRGLADGVGSIQGAGVSRLNPDMRRAAFAMSGVDPRLVDAVGLNRAFTQRWTDRLAAGATTTT